MCLGQLCNWTGYVPACIPAWEHSSQIANLPCIRRSSYLPLSTKLQRLEVSCLVFVVLFNECQANLLLFTFLHSSLIRYKTEHACLWLSSSSVCQSSCISAQSGSSVVLHMNAQLSLAHTQCKAWSGLSQLVLLLLETLPVPVLCSVC